LNKENEQEASKNDPKKEMAMTRDIFHYEMQSSINFKVRIKGYYYREPSS